MEERRKTKITILLGDIVDPNPKARQWSANKCLKKWHIKRDCLEWKRGKDKDKEGSLRSANVVAVDLDSDGDMLFVSSSTNLLIDS